MYIDILLTKFACNSGARILLLELYAKQDKDREDPLRIRRYLKSV